MFRNSDRNSERSRYLEEKYENMIREESELLKEREARSRREERSRREAFGANL